MRTERQLCARPSTSTGARWNRSTAARWAFCGARCSRCPFTVYADFLARWQHLAPGERLRGEGALVQVLQQLRAAPVVGRVWERDVLPLRLAHYQPAELEALCQGGELVWVGAGGADPRRGRVRFLFRGEGSVYLEPAPEDLSALSDPARAVYEFLRSEGAAFFADMCAATELAAARVETALNELVMAGLVTNDSLEAMREMVERGSPQPQAPRPLERTGRTVGPPPGAARSSGEAVGAQARPRAVPGRQAPRAPAPGRARG